MATSEAPQVYGHVSIAIRRWVAEAYVCGSGVVYQLASPAHTQDRAIARLRTLYPGVRLISTADLYAKARECGDGDFTQLPRRKV